MVVAKPGIGANEADMREAGKSEGERRARAKGDVKRRSMTATRTIWILKMWFFGAHTPFCPV